MWRATEAAQFLQALPEREDFPTGRGVVVKFEGADSEHVHRPIRTTDTTVISQRDALRVQARIRRAREGNGRVVIEGKDAQVLVANVYPVNSYRSTREMSA